MIVIEMVYPLWLLQCHEIDVTYLCSPFEVIVWRPNILILSPTSIQQRPSQLGVPSLDDKHLLIVSNSVASFPSWEINDFLFFLSLFLVNRFVFVVVNFFFGFLLGGVAVNEGSLWLVFETSQLLVGNIVEFDSAFVSSLGLLIFQKNLINIAIFKWQNLRIRLTFKPVHIVLSPPKQTVKTDNLVSQGGNYLFVLDWPTLLDWRKWLYFDSTVLVRLDSRCNIIRDFLLLLRLVVNP